MHSLVCSAGGLADEVLVSLACTGPLLQKQQRLQVLQRQMARRKQRCSEGQKHVTPFSPVPQAAAAGHSGACRQVWETAQPSEPGRAS